MRCFVAIPLPASLTGPLFEWCEALRKQDSAVRWIIPDNLHLNLKFLGEVDPEKFDEKFFEGFTQLLHPFEPIPLTVGTLGQFPPKGIPRVLWTGVGGEGLSTLHRLATIVEDFLERSGFSKEPRPFAPHITLARLKTKPSSGLLRAWRESVDAVFGDFVADRIAFFRSELTKGGAIYTVVREFSLGTTAGSR